MRTIAKRVAAVEKIRKPLTPWERRSKAERDAEVAAVLDDPVQLREVMARLVGEENADGRTLAFSNHRAAIAAAGRADT